MVFVVPFCNNLLTMRLRLFCLPYHIHDDHFHYPYNLQCCQQHRNIRRFADVKSTTRRRVCGNRRRGEIIAAGSLARLVLSAKISRWLCVCGCVCACRGPWRLPSVAQTTASVLSHVCIFGHVFALRHHD